MPVSTTIRLRHAATFLVATAILCLELVHMRLLSVAMWQSLVYCVITVAMLGFGASGAFLSLWRRAYRGSQERLLTAATLLFAVTNLFGVFLCSRISVDAFQLIQHPTIAVTLAAYFGLLGAPYFAGGMVTGIVLARNPRHTASLYAASLAGSGLGCVIFLALLMPLGAERLLVLMSVLATVAAVLFSWGAWRRGVLLSLAVAVAVSAVMPAAPRLYDMKVSPSKIPPQLLEGNPDNRVAYRRWTATGRIDVVSSPDLVYHNPHTGQDWPFHIILTDGDAHTKLFHHPSGGRTPFMPMEGAALNAAYDFVTTPEVLIIGVGGGREIWQALGKNAARVTAVEINPATVHVLREAFAETLGRPIDNPRVTLVNAEGRNHVRMERPGSFDLVYMCGVDTFAALSSGAYTMAESYLYTEDAFRDYLRVLKPDGVLSISQYSFVVPREIMRLTVTSMEALRDSGVKEPWRHVFVLRERDWGTVVVKKSPFTNEEVDRIEERARKYGHGIAYRPGLEQLPVTRDTVARYGTGIAQPAPYGAALNPMTAYVLALQEGHAGSFLQDFAYNVRPVTDDNPFFFRYYKWNRVLLGTGQPIVMDAGGGSLALVVMAFLLAAAGIAVVVFMLLPLAVASRRQGIRVPAGRAIRYGAYFIALGAGFMLLEICLMQKFSLYLGHPTYSIATVLSTMLIGSGVGSLVSGMLPWSPRRIIFLSIAGIGILVALYGLVFPSLLPGLLAFGPAVRNTIGAALIAPLAFLMGMPFPTGLRSVEQDSATLVPWAWGVNGAASVLASVAAVIIAVQTGFSFVMYLAAATYVAGLVGVLKELPTTCLPKSEFEG